MSFPKVEKVEPVYRDEAGELHQRVLQTLAVKDPDATRAECDGKVIWIKPLNN